MERLVERWDLIESITKQSYNTIRQTVLLIFNVLFDISAVLKAATENFRKTTDRHEIKFITLGLCFHVR